MLLPVPIAVKGGTSRVCREKKTFTFLARNSIQMYFREDFTFRPSWKQNHTKWRDTVRSVFESRILGISEKRTMKIKYSNAAS